MERQRPWLRGCNHNFKRFKRRAFRRNKRQREVIRLETELSELKRAHDKAVGDLKAAHAVELMKLQGKMTSDTSASEKIMIPHDPTDPDVGPPGTLL
jgi:hypothetical protein